MKFAVIITAFVFFSIEGSFASDLRSYVFKPNLSSTSEYQGPKTFTNIFYSDFTTKYAIVMSDDPLEVERYFNFELRKSVIRDGIGLYESMIQVSKRGTVDTRSQEGTLNLKSTAGGEYFDYVVNPLKINAGELQGNIEFFEFRGSLTNSYIVVDVELGDWETGKVLWITTISGRVGDVLSYIPGELYRAR